MKSLLPTLLLSIFLTSTLSTDWQEGTADRADLRREHKCSHDHIEHKEPELLDVDENFGDDHTGRFLGGYSSLRTRGYYGRLSSTTSSFRSYIENDLVPPVLDYLSGALRNKYPVQGQLKVDSGSICDGSTPSELRNGVNADFYYILEADMDTSRDWVASSTACLLATGSKRPLVAKTSINRNLLKSTNDVLLHEKNIIVLIHEAIHTLGFSSFLFKNFINNNGQTIKNIVQSVSLNGKRGQALVAEPLLSKVRNHFGCSHLKGAYLENSGSEGTSGSHFERRHYGHEAMTSGNIYEMAVSELTLAVLETSGWYAVDYDYADHYSWGQGQGCNFLESSCSSSGFKFEEFCNSNNAKRGCTQSGRSGGKCDTDSRSDNCKFYHGEVDWHCENPDAEAYAKLPGIQTFGRNANSKCFEGTLSSNSQTSETTFCFKYSCSGNGSGTKLEVHVGGNTVTCSRAGEVSVSGYNGHITCPDPVNFCSTIGKKRCPRGCMGRGSCNNGVCSCHSGYKGKDCALN